MLHVTPEYIVVVSNPAEIIVDEDVSEMSCECMFEGFWYFRNKDRLLPNEEIKEE